MRSKGIRTVAVAAAIISVLFALSLGAGLTFANPNDDDIPGMSKTLPFEATGTLDASTPDQRDVYAVELRAGQTIEASLTADDGTDFDLYLYPPDTGVIRDLTESWVYSSTVGTSTEDLKCMVWEAGTYYLDVQARSGGGAYRLASHTIPTQPFSLGSVVTAKSAKRGTSVRVSLTIAPVYNGWPYSPITFNLYRWESGKWRLKLIKNALSSYDVGAAQSVFSTTYKFPSKGKWAIRGCFQDAAHVTKKLTAYTKITIK